MARLAGVADAKMSEGIVSRAAEFRDAAADALMIDGA